MKTVKEIIRDYLNENEFDGLYQPGECACEKSDLAPCGETPLDCMVGYKIPCECEWDIGCTWDIGPEKSDEDDFNTPEIWTIKTIRL